METPGEYLKRERAIRGIPLEDIAKVTKIRLKILTALEKDEFDALPAQPFVKGFIQAYCKYLGLDVQDALLRYESYMKGIAEKEAATVHEAEVKENTKSIPPSSSPIIVISAIVLFGIVGTTYILSTRKTPVTSDSSHSQVQVEPKKEEPSLPINSEDKTGLPANSSVSTLLKKENKGIKESLRPQAGNKEKEPLTLIIEATRPSWIRAVIDDHNPFEVSLKQGEKVKWNAKERFSILIGNAGGVHAIFNGKSLGMLGDDGKVIKLVLPPPKDKDKDLVKQN